MIDPDALLAEALGAIRDASDEKTLEDVRVRFLGRKGTLTTVLRGLGSLPPEERGRVGQGANRVKDEIGRAIDERRVALETERDAFVPSVDVTLPARELPLGRRHVLATLQEEIREIFHGMGFSVALGPDVEDDYHNFEALNIPRGHPAREMHDTFFLSETMLLRTHTSPVQIRVMQGQPPPIRMIFPGRVYRNEAIDASHAAEFTQCEILYVDEGVSFRDLRGCLHSFIARLFGPDIALRFRPSYFPFTEPSAELDISCLLCKGPGCPACKQTGWVEVLGCGMVHPKVFEFVGIDASRYTGYAAGMGIERLAMLRYGIRDIRAFSDNDLRFLAQF
jgi:phenylalanyl-tRNA synthetase alpha chain